MAGKSTRRALQKRDRPSLNDVFDKDGYLYVFDSDDMNRFLAETRKHQFGLGCRAGTAVGLTCGVIGIALHSAMYAVSLTGYLLHAAVALLALLLIWVPALFNKPPRPRTFGALELERAAEIIGYEWFGQEKPDDYVSNIGEAPF